MKSKTNVKPGELTVPTGDLTHVIDADRLNVSEGPSSLEAGCVDAAVETAPSVEPKDRPVFIDMTVHW